MKGLRAAKKLAKDAVDQASAAAADAAGGVANLRTSSSAHNAQPPLRELFDRIDADSPGRPGRLSGLGVSHSKSVLYGAFVWARRALNNQKWRFPARAVVLFALPLLAALALLLKLSQVTFMKVYPGEH